MYNSVFDGLCCVLKSLEGVGCHYVWCAWVSEVFHTHTCMDILCPKFSSSASFSSILSQNSFSPISISSKMTMTTSQHYLSRSPRYKTAQDVMIIVLQHKHLADLLAHTLQHAHAHQLHDPFSQTHTQISSIQNSLPQQPIPLLSNQ